MGFYAPAQLVADARRHGVEVCPPDVTISAWDCTLENRDALRFPAIAGKRGASLFLLLGLRMIGGLSEAGAQRIVAARQGRPFRDVADLAHRATLDRRDLEALADADALASLAGHRHRAAWDAAGVERLPPLLAGAGFDEVSPALPAPTEGREIAADYRRLGLDAAPPPSGTLAAPVAREAAGCG